MGASTPAKHDLSSINLVVCAGEVLNPPAWEWLQKDVLKDRVPVVDHMWQKSLPVAHLKWKNTEELIAKIGPNAYRKLIAD